MGWRAMRLALERDGLMKAQARALIEAASGRTLHVMFPMVSEPWEFDAARGIVRSAARLADRQGQQTAAVYPLWRDAGGAGACRMLDVLLPDLDFLSIGTNDLTQFLFAADRANPKLAERYDWLSPAILRFLRRVVPRRRRQRARDASAAKWAGGRWRRWR